MDALMLETSNAMDHVIQSYEKEISKVRTGRANPNMIENIKVEVYGDLEPLKNIASIKVAEARQLLVKAYDHTATKTIAETLNNADLKVQINVDSNNIRLIFPTLTEETRKQLVRELAKTTEEFRIKVRNCRRDGIQKLKQQELPEDMQKKQEQEIQKITDQKIALINSIEKDKMADLMHV